MDLLKTRFSHHVRAELARRGIAQLAVDRELGLPYHTLRRALSPRDEGLSTGTIIRVSEALGLDPVLLLGPVP